MNPIRFLKGLFFYAGIRGRGSMLRPGDKAPEFRARTHDGRTIALEDLRGQHVILWFYPKADTPG